jgi:hypothetical protein
MSRAMNLAMAESAVLDHCRQRDVGVSAIEPLESGGVRLVCMSSEGAGLVRRTLKSKLINGDVERTRHRPAHADW